MILDWVRAIGRFVARALTAEKAPYLLALFFTAAGWTVVRTTDRISTAPIVEYELGDDSVAKVASVRLRNITSAVRFTCFSLTVASGSATAFRLNTTRMHSINIRGPVLVKISRTGLDSELATFSVQDFGPGADFEIRLPSIQGGMPHLLASPCPDASKSEGPSPILLPRSYKTWLTENEVLVLWVGLSIWLLLMLAMFGFA